MNETINPQQLQQAITWAKSNPTDPRAVELQNRIQSGSLNDSMKSLGYDTSSYVAPPTPPESPAAPAKDGFVKSTLKSLVSAPATMLARPIQAGAELLGASDTQVNNVTKKLTGGIVAPVPENGADVKKDVGRGIETVALGAGSPVAGGAAFGAGNSLEQGNDLFSGQTAFQTVLGGTAGKVLQLIGTPILNAAGKVVGKVTPQFLSDIASQGTKAITDFAAAHDILPDVASKAINGANDAVAGAESKVAGAVSDAKSAVVNKVKGQSNDITDLLKQHEDTMTPTMKKSAIEEGRQTIKTTKTGGTEVDYTPTKEIKRASEILSNPEEFKNPVTSKDEPNVVYAKTKQAISQRGAEAEKFLKDNPVQVTPEEHKTMLDTMKSKAAETSTDTEMNAYNEQIGLFEKQLKGGTTTSDYYTALKNYEENIASKMAKGKEALIDPTGIASAKVQAASDIRSSVRDMIGNKHPEFKPKMYDIASLYEAKDNALFSASKTKSQSFLDKHPNAKNTAKAMLGGATLLEGGKKVLTGSF